MSRIDYSAFFIAPLGVAVYNIWIMQDTKRLSKLLMIFLFIVIAVGLVVLTSAGLADAQRKFGSSYYYIGHQLLYGLVPGLILFFVFSKIPYRFWRKFSVVFILGAVALLIMIFIPGFGVNLKGAHRWLDIGPVQFQPSEFLKFALVVYLAAWFASREKMIGDVTYALLPLVLILGFISALLIAQPDLGTLLITIMIAVAIYFLSGAHLKHFAGLGVVLVLFILILSLVSPYRFARLKAFVNPEHDTRGVSYHINQALISIGSGGVFGVGFGQSRQKQAYLPEPVGDSIFAVAVEETGFVGALVIVGLYTTLIVITILIGKNAPDLFSQLLVLGAAVWLSAQVFVNIGAISGMIPLTGVPLPFMSYGSSSLVALMSMFGIVTNVARTK